MKHKQTEVTCFVYPSYTVVPKATWKQLQAATWHLVHYCEDFITIVPKKNFHLPTLQTKCRQVRALLHLLEGS